MTKALAKEWVRRHITVNCAAPGYTVQIVGIMDFDNIAKHDGPDPICR